MRNPGLLLLAVWIAGTFPLGCGRGTSSASNQLVGRWVYVQTPDMKAMEFNSDGKVLLYYNGGGDAITADYAMQPDGRLSISTGGLVNFYQPAVSDDQLQLTQESGAVARFRRMQPNETVTAAVSAQEHADVEAVQARNAAVPAFLARADLVLISVPQKGPAPRGMLGEDLSVRIPTPAAVQFTPDGSDYAGRIVYDARPPRMDLVGAQLQNMDSDNPTVAIWFGPGTATQNRQTYFFHPSGTAPNLTLTYSILTGGPPALILKADAVQHARILGGLKR